MVRSCDNDDLRIHEIISVSRRTDIPAFYTDWFINAIKRGYVCWVNPFNPRQIQKISLKPQHVKVIVFWTRNPEPLIPYLKYLDDAGYKYYFHYTVNNYSRKFDRFVPSFEKTVGIFKRLSEMIGKERVILRYDPIFFTEEMDVHFHMKNFERILSKLGDHTNRVMISFLDMYSKTLRNLKKFGIRIHENVDVYSPSVSKMLEHFSEISKSKNVEILSCAEKNDLEMFGIKSGKCIDDELIRRLFKIRVNPAKDRNQRKYCSCVKSKDIGMYDTCLHGCVYCYAVSSHERAMKNYRKHDPNSPFLYNICCM